MWWVYQFLKTEWEKNIQWSYYTPKNIVSEQVKCYFQKDLKFLDPCCGTWQYLMSIETKNPLNLYWCDIDEIAVKIARINLMLKYHTIDFAPNIFHFDFLSLNTFDSLLFDVIATNPPWGAKLSQSYENFNIQSWEIYSYFIEKSLKILKEWWIFSGILPESVLNVWVHRDIRKILLNYNIKSIYDLWRPFNWVFSKVVRLDVVKQTGKQNNKIGIYLKNWKHYVVDKSTFKNNNDFAFSIYQNKEDEEIFSQLLSNPHFFLDNKNSDWALWVITWDNKKFISKTLKEKHVPVYTWKEVDFYKLKPPKNFLLYEPEKFQQIASEEKYTTKPKVIYKFISSKLVFSLDEEWVFTLNSANILIPKIDYSFKVIVALFNSSLYQRFFEKKFNSIKILKKHIQSLPLPLLEEEKIKEIEKMFDEVVDGKIKKEAIDIYLFNLLIKKH